MKRKILVALAVMAVAAGLYFRIVMWPWLAAPEKSDVDRAWAAVERGLAEGPAPRHDDEEAFRTLGAKTRRAGEDLARLSRLGGDRNDETLPESVHDALVALDTWAKTIGDEERKLHCDREAAAQYLYASLADVALLAHPDDARITSFVKLSERLRRRGTFVSYAIGMRVLDYAMDAGDRAGAWPAALRETGVDTKELRGALAREASCIDELFEGATSSFFARDASVGRDYAPWFARAFVRPERERAMVRLTLGSRLERCEGAIADARAYLDCANPKIDDLDALPKSVGARAVVAVYTGEKFTATITRHLEHAR